MDLVMDFGNSFKKFALFEKDKIVKFESLHADQQNLQDFLFDFAGDEMNSPDLKAIISSVVNYPTEFDAFLSSKTNVLKLDHQTPLPVTLKYKTPATLGKDRMAIASAAVGLYPGANVLAIVCGSCITYDFVDTTANYHGGAIAPGLNMRFKSLHTFTDHLPLLKGKMEVPLTGTTTEESILSGVIHGMKHEMDGIIDQYRSIYENLTVLISGGDLNYFDKSLKNNIFAIPNLVLEGLKIILDFNESS